MPRTRLELVEISPASQRDQLVAGSVDAALVRLPIDKTDLHAIPLYDEVPVVVFSLSSASPVFTRPAGSTSITEHSSSAIGHQSWVRGIG